MVPLIVESAGRENRCLDRCTMHRGTDFDDLRYTRDTRRATVSDVANTCEQEGATIP
jgi:hypothetical protein